jgi:hypothetical protein
VPQLLDALASGRGPGAQVGELLADLPLVAAQLPGELAETELLAGADLAGPVVAFHRGRQPLGVGGVATDGGLLVAAGSEVCLQPASCSAVGRPWLTGWLRTFRPWGLWCWARSPANHWRAIVAVVPSSAANSLGSSRPLPASSWRK